MSEIFNPQEIKEQYEDLQRLIEDLVSIRVGAPIYEMNHGAVNHFQERKSGENYIRESTIDETKKIIHGIILPTGTTREFVLLGIDNSAIVLKSSLPNDDIEILPDGSGLRISPNSHFDKDRSIASIALDSGGLSNFHKIILDISKKPEETIEIIGKSISYAKAEAKKIQENRQKALPNVIKTLRSFFENE